MIRTKLISIEVAYATETEQVIESLRVPDDTKLSQVIAYSHLPERFAELKQWPLDLGICGKAMPLETLLKPNDRVEIYRPLTMDPKERRRQLAAAKLNDEHSVTD
ncbi:MAG: RnfH family protein [Neisseriaceae bacterium]|nr:RnfH family protein [Neisseriaceae bacterium]MBP6861027.1 RnfH family protein [Neisseriaceae bacterium]